MDYEVDNNLKHCEVCGLPKSVDGLMRYLRDKKGFPYLVALKNANCGILGTIMDTKGFALSGNPPTLSHTLTLKN